MSEQKPPESTIRVHLDEAQLGGAYVNMARIFHNQTEFVVDTMFIPPASNVAKVTARLIMSPVHAKQLLRALTQNVQTYEQKFGEIAVPVGPGPGILH